MDSSGATWRGVGYDGNTLERPGIGVAKAWRKPFLELLHAAIDWEDGALAFRCHLLDKRAQRIEYLLQRATNGDHLQQPLLAREQALGALEIVDVGLEHIPLCDFTFGISQRLAVDLKPAIDAVGSKQAMLVQQPLAGLPRTFLSGDHVGNVVGMHELRARPALDLFECGPEVFEDRPVATFYGAIRPDDADEAGNAIGYE